MQHIDRYHNLMSYLNFPIGQNLLLMNALLLFIELNLILLLLQLLYTATTSHHLHFSLIL